MNKMLFATTIIWFLGFVSFAQESKSQNEVKPNFTGTWELENKKVSGNRILVITHTGDELTITDTIQYNGKPVINKTTLYSDKRGERNVFTTLGADFETEIKSTTYWKKDKLVRNSTFTSPAISATNRYTVSHKETQTYSLSSDGNLLTINLQAFSESPLSDRPRIDFFKNVYRRKK